MLNVSPVPPSTEKIQSAKAATLAWAIFLASSWTWCIGMFLPVLFVRDYGIAGWLVFAVPNVCGAAAMGWMLRSRGQSAALVQRHREACLCFSVVTLLFHVFFIGWIITPMIGSGGPIVLALLSMLAFIGATRWLRPGADLVGGALAMVLSLGVLVFGLTAGYFPKFPPGGLAGTLSPLDLVFLGPVTVFGFLLCPYLDLTFHRARLATSESDAKIAFTLGFGLFFLAMIVLTLCYAGWLAPLAQGVSAATIPPLLRWLIAAHLVVQSSFTMAVHFRAYSSSAGSLLGIHGVIPLVGCLAVIGLALWCQSPVRYHGISRGEIVYRCFMAFYGLVFPAYVWLCMVPGRDRRSGATREKLIVLAAAIAIAAPAYWLGFIERQMAWLMPGIIVILLARLMLPRARSSV